MGFLGGSEVKASTSNDRDPGSIPGSGRSSGEGNGNTLQYSCLENFMDGGAWWATVHGVAELDMTERLTLSKRSHSHMLQDVRASKKFFLNWITEIFLKTTC